MNKLSTKTQLDRNIAKALKERRSELHAELSEIATQLSIFEPPKPIVVRTAGEISDARVLEWVTGDWATTQEFAKKTGMHQRGTTRTLNRLTEQGVLESKDINKVTHFRRKPERKRISVGNGELR
jgi:hypothetical protein